MIELNDNDGFNYSGWLNSDKLWKRSLAVWGHAIFGYILAVLTLVGLYLVYVILFE